MDVAINYGAILVSGILSVVLGFIWYGPLFGKQWMVLSGVTMPEEKPSAGSMVKPMIISVIGTILMAYTLTHALAFGNTYLGISGISAALQGAFWHWLGFVVPVNLNFLAWEGKSWKLFAINTGYWLVLLALVAILITVWI